MKIRASKKIFHANFVLQTCHPNKPGWQFYVGALFCALLRPFAFFCVCALLRSLALICVFLRPTAFRTTAFLGAADQEDVNGEKLTVKKW